MTSAIAGSAERPRHPPGLAYLAFTEVWERFSFYGMQALLLLYMVDRLLTPGVAENVLGLDDFKTGLEGVFGPLSNQAFASQVFGLYTGLVYFTPVFGGLLGDRVLGQRKTVVLGALLLTAGHALMAFEATFLLALLVLILGCGCLKGNISAQVGQLYPKADPRRTHGFTIFNVAINIGVFTAPLVCGALGEIYGWSWGFGAAAVGMVVGLIVYLAGGRHMPPDTLRKRDADTPRPKLQPGDGRIIAALSVMLLLGMFYSTAYAQEFGVFAVWARDTLNREILGWTMPVTWLFALDGGFTIALTPLALWIWRRQAKRAHEPSDLTKMAVGAALGALGMACLAAASMIAAHSGRPSVGWAIACFALFSLGFIYQWPTTLALVSRAAPAPVNATMMGMAFLIGALIPNYTAGLLGGLYEQMAPAQFWLLHAAIAFAGAVLTWMLARPINSVLAPEYVEARSAAVPAPAL